MARDPRDVAYEAAQVCVNGHPITEYADSSPEATVDRCPRCGAETITGCTNCEAIIRGHRRGGYPRFEPFSPPAFCHGCGKPHPWTEARIHAAKELAQLIEGSPQDKKLLEASIDELVRDAPSATVAAVRFKSMVAKAGKTFADGFRDILVDVLSETVKKTIWP
jgi:hypothetical protein